MPNSTTTDRILRDTLSRAADGAIDTITDDGRPELGTAGPAPAELVTDLAERLSVVIPDEETGRLHTVADLRALLARPSAPSGTDAS
ncbi:hypothetical protein [Streptomyces sp. NBC_01006]|uniref:hypothetical protein n=1 Tax=Streptomyces sp. NBC_01006 TaxID=2903716 RepID=UPI00386E8D01|nr:hypothetical protein OG509_40665 [Streptomyces sp. NBC_01006]